MLFICHGDEVAYARQLYALPWRYRERSTEEKELYWMSLSCSEPSYNKFHLVRNAAGWWNALSFERRQRMDVRVSRFVGLQNRGIFSVPLRVCNVLFRAVQDVLGECECARPLSVPKLVLFTYKTDKAPPGTGSIRNLTQNVAKVCNHVMCLVRFHTVRGTV